MKKTTNVLFLGLILSVFLTACSGDNSTPDAQVRDTQSPNIAAVSDIEINADAVSNPIILSVTDNETVTASITLTASSSNTEVIADEGLSLSGTNLVLTPVSDTVGTSSITVSATDSAGNTSTAQFTVLVIPREIMSATFVNDISALEMDAAPVFINQVQLTGEIDEDSGFDALVED